MEIEIEELQYEQKLIIYAIVKFASILKHNAITPYNDDQLSYLKYQLNVESNQEIIDRLKQIIGNYEEEEIYFEEKK